MSGIIFAIRVVEAWCELARFDCVQALTGAPQLIERGRMPAASPVPDRDSGAVIEAMATAACLYWKPVLCLQRAASLTTLLRRHRIAARLVIGYRSSPFVAHAWVEVDGRVIDGSDGYAKRLHVLHVS